MKELRLPERALRAAIIGAGDISRVHAQALSATGIQLVAVVDHDQTRAQALARTAGAQAWTGTQQMLEQIEVDVVHVCTPHDQHLSVARQALARSKHVLVEKPLACDLESALALATAAQESPGTLGVCFQNRYNPTSVAMAAVLGTGELGAVRGADATLAWHRGPAYYRAKPWAGIRARAGGGVLINQAIHTLDLLQWLLGPVTQVAASASTLRPMGSVDVEDTVSLSLTHTEQIRSVMWATNTHAFDEPIAIRVRCEQGTLELRDSTLKVTGPGGVRMVSDAAAPDEIPDYWGVGHRGLIADFYTHLKGGQPFWLDADAALASQRIIDQVYQHAVT
ncbi:MAG: Gfo/Idh/MocA family protein [Beutenbergiaceae bacterium]